jgi:hypothetical protein
MHETDLAWDYFYSCVRLVFHEKLRSWGSIGWERHFCGERTLLAFTMHGYIDEQDAHPG